MMSRKHVLIDLAVVLLTLISIRASLQSVSARYAGSISTIAALALATLLLWLQRRSWLDVGLRGRMTLLRTLLTSLVLFVMVILIVLPMTLSAERLFERSDDVARFGHLEGNLGALLWYGLLSVAVGGFAEELVYRGFVLSRLVDLFGETRGGIALGVILQASFFGFRHLYWQGPVGAISAFSAALVFGAAYFVLKRDLWPLIIVHASIDLMGFVEDYFGV